MSSGAILELCRCVGYEDEPPAALSGRSVAIILRRRRAALDERGHVWFNTPFGWSGPVRLVHGKVLHLVLSLDEHS